MSAEKSCLMIWLFLLLIFYPLTAYADMGPKPQITIRVVNPPEQEYYLDLLVKGDGTYDNLEYDEKDYDPVKLAFLQSYDADEWHPGLTQGTAAPMHGKLTGVEESGYRVHTFSYMGVPEYFKIILVTPDNRLVISEEINKTAFAFSMDYDYNTGEISIPQIIYSYIRQFIMTCLPTLFLEGIVLKLFGFSFRRNWKPFFGINILTQIFLTAAVGKIMIEDGQIATYYAIIPIEILIFLSEMLAFSLLLKEHNKTRRAWFAFTANLFSFLAGMVSLLWI